MVVGRRSEECDFCCAPYGTWAASLGMALCSVCARTGEDRPARDPVLVGDVLADLALALPVPEPPAFELSAPALSAPERRDP
ncbi:hypothetical protein C5L38_16440 [Streptomyces sp. WAC00288]|uniref:hypothetical protein n=1 Tax=Streptomyces sp. WAC04657 TaxID=1779145 RepID=UPI0007874A27|nr:hypothetical protein [Streptomyces sp. WAC04657]AVH96457.1 hypothetical protein C5L38_16440 [Streptomyces sp. WAC00288]KYG55101.1 hypothetical protein AWI43_12165 [Streptomyces sp. WAC04657]